MDVTEPLPPVFDSDNGAHHYDAHVKYITALRKQGEIDKLRQAREAMSELFPLVPSLWQEWAKDEISLGASVSDVGKLYERGVSDYLSVPLWCDYLNFSVHYDPIDEQSNSKYSKSRELFERALIAAGLHVSEGSKIWEAYRKYEEAILNSIIDIDTDTDSSEAAIEKQLGRIRNIFHRQLSVPHTDLKSTLLAYKSWEAEQGCNGDVPCHVASAYDKALEMLNARCDLEERISRPDLTDSLRFQNFMAYLKYEQSCCGGNPSRVQCLFERAVVEFPTSGDLWLDYTNYLGKTLKGDKNLRHVFQRATRNCPWVGQIWVQYLIYLESCRASEKEISHVFENSLVCTFSTLDEYLDIFLTRADGLRRRMIAKEELDFTLIRDTFQRASDYLSPQLLENNAYSLLRIHSYWARLESSLGIDFTAARGVWERLIKNCGASLVEAWQGYIAMEIQMGHINEARSLYKKCYSKRFPGTGSEDICNSWVQFEREYGTLENFDHALQKVTPRLQELHFLRLKEEESKSQKEDFVKKNVCDKRKHVSDLNKVKPAKRQKDEPDVSDLNKPVKRKKDENDHKAQVKTSVEENIIESQKVARTPDRGDDLRKKDKCTVFISNIDPITTHEDLRSFFDDVGGVVAVRILNNKLTNKPRGIAFVDFDDETHLEAAVAKNKKVLLGRKLSVARSDPNRGKGKSNSTEHDNVQLKGKNTFMPRAVRQLEGFTNTNKPRSGSTSNQGDEPFPNSKTNFSKPRRRMEIDQ